MQKPKLFDAARNVARLRYLSYKTEQASVHTHVFNRVGRCVHSPLDLAGQCSAV